MDAALRQVDGVGAGAAGLLAAVAARRLGHEVLVVEASSVVGGTTATTDGSGLFSFDGLANAVVYTLTLPDLPSEPVDVEGQWGKLSWVEFVQVR